MDREVGLDFRLPLFVGDQLAQGVVVPRSPAGPPGASPRRPLYWQDGSAQAYGRGFDKNLDEDCSEVTGTLRGPWGVLLILANLLSTYIAYGSLMIQPQGAWDDSTLTGIGFASGLLTALGVLTVLLTLFAVLRRALSRWWLAPPLISLVAGLARLRYIEYAHPAGPGG
ncbi:hypothetical protein [Streptomyces atroolivaceus]|uniref:Uncharacterized protein n=2 Tax=Streptomyces atroolivaceus TaxID=66869 RepID=A0ABV9VH73_STRAZ|nr:hypothetical protein [Streptomyces atroolivaceus]